MAAIDRRKHDLDVIERVLGVARDSPEGRGGHTQVVDLGVRPWFGGSLTSAAQMTIGGLALESHALYDRDLDDAR